KTIEILRRTLGERKNIFLRVRVEAARPKKVTPLKGRPGWVGYVQRRYAEELEKRFLVGETYSDKAIRACWQGILEKAVDIYKKIS
ncbi:MAG: hypothetical protein IKO94_01950, partial [Selenomonadaceae bacterium]|nr:hypothetical protein [Selenomonadaceae bacterium]